MNDVVDAPGESLRLPEEAALLTLWRHRRELNERELARLAEWWEGPRLELPELALERGPQLTASYPHANIQGGLVWATAQAGRDPRSGELVTGGLVSWDPALAGLSA